jgi:GT2 family glycosyltransferase
MAGAASGGETPTCGLVSGPIGNPAEDGVMVPGSLPRVDAVVLAWLAEPVLRDSVGALLASEKVDVRVFLVDNGCTTDDVEHLENVPGVQVLRPGHNLGFSAGCNLGAAAGDGEYVALVNGDAVVAPDALARLVAELQARPEVGLAAGAVRLADNPERLNSSGNVVHVLGLSWVGGLGEPETRTAPTDTAGAMGAFVVTSRVHWQRLGGFYEPYFAYHEDADISIRTWQAGLRVVNVPDAVAVHRYEFSRNPDKFYLVERNRLMFVATLWGPRALVLLAPPLLGLEAGMVLLALRQGWLPRKVAGWRWLWHHRRELAARRRLVRAAVTVPDRAWMGVLTDTLDTPLVELPRVVRAPLNAAMRLYWAVASRLV